MSFKGRGGVIRRMAAAGRTPEEIADLYGFDRAAVALFLSTSRAEHKRKHDQDRAARDRLRNPPKNLHGLGSAIRVRSSEGWTVEAIAAYFGADPAAVASLLETDVAERKRRLALDRYWRDRPRTERPIRAQTATRVRELVGQGWKTDRIAIELDLDPDRVREFARRIKPVRGDRLVIPRTRPEQARLDGNRRKARARTRARAKAAADRAARWTDEWKTAAAEDPRYRDPITPAAPIPRPVEDLDPAPEPPDLVEAREPGPIPAGAKPGMKADDWSQWFVRGEAHGRSRLTEDQVRSIRAQHAAGRSHRELAGMFGVHRQSIFNICTGRTWTHV